MNDLQHILIQSEYIVRCYGGQASGNPLGYQEKPVFNKYASIFEYVSNAVYCTYICECICSMLMPYGRIHSSVSCVDQYSRNTEGTRHGGLYIHLRRTDIQF